MVKLLLIIEKTQSPGPTSDKGKSRGSEEGTTNKKATTFNTQEQQHENEDGAVSDTVASDGEDEHKEEAIPVNILCF